MLRLNDRDVVYVKRDLTWVKHGVFMHGFWKSFMYEYFFVVRVSGKSVTYGKPNRKEFCLLKKKKSILNSFCIVDSPITN